MKRIFIIIILFIAVNNVFADGTFDKTRNYQGMNAMAYLHEILYINDFPEPVDLTRPWTENKDKIVAYYGFKDIEKFDGNDMYTSENNTMLNYHFDRNFEWQIRGTEEKWLKGKRFYVYNIYPIKQYNGDWVFEMYNVDDPSDKVAYVYHGWYHLHKKDAGDIYWVGRFNNFPMTCKKYLDYKKEHSN